MESNCRLSALRRVFRTWPLVYKLSCTKAPCAALHTRLTRAQLQSKDKRQEKIWMRERDNKHWLLAPGLKVGASQRFPE